VSIRIAFLLLIHPFTGSSQVNAPLFAIDRSHVGSKFSPHRTTPPRVPYDLILPINIPFLAPSLTPPHHLLHPFPSLPSPPLPSPNSRIRLSRYLNQTTTPLQGLGCRNLNASAARATFSLVSSMLRLFPSILDSRTQPKL